LLSVFGGKITTYRRLAEHALEKLEVFLPALRDRAWTKGSSLPGGEFATADGASRLGALQARYPFLEARTVLRLHRAYGCDVSSVLGDAAQPGDLGIHFGAGLYQREVAYLVANEWARTAEDILWRRTKLGLRFTREEAMRLAAFLSAALGERA
jgi:glycerol-3-phosphate dehydrogenase